MDQSTTLHNALHAIHYTELTLDYMALHSTSFILHAILHYTTLHYTTLHYTHHCAREDAESVCLAECMTAHRESLSS
jgi:hypothetical protein